MPIGIQRDIYDKGYLCQTDIGDITHIQADCYARALTITPKGKGVTHEEFRDKLFAWKPPGIVHFAYLIPEVSGTGLNHGHGVITYRDPKVTAYPMNIPKKMHKDKDLVILLREFDENYEEWYGYIRKGIPQGAEVPFYFYFKGKWSKQTRREKTLDDYFKLK